jgi:hypothetical protein
VLVPGAQVKPADLTAETVVASEEPELTYRRTVRWWREIAFVAAFYTVYDVIRGVMTRSQTQAQRDGYDLLKLERFAHLDPEHWLNDQLQHVAVLAVPACFIYATLHFIVTPTVLIWAYRWRPFAYRQARTVLAVVTAAALAGFWWFPTAPPRLLAGSGFHDTLLHYGRWGWWGSDASVPAGAAAIANQVAAMPSLHLAWAAWCGATVYTLTHRRWIRAIAVGYPVVIALVVLGTGNHYLLDVLVGAALWAVAHGAVRYLARLSLLGLK